MLHWWPLLVLHVLSWCPIFKSSHCSSFDNQVPVDGIDGYLFVKWVSDLTKWVGTSSVVSWMATRWYTILVSTVHIIGANLWKSLCIVVVPYEPYFVQIWIFRNFTAISVLVWQVDIKLILIWTFWFIVTGDMVKCQWPTLLQVMAWCQIGTKP